MSEPTAKIVAAAALVGAPDAASVPRVITESTPLSVAEVQARPVTLGLIVVLGMALLSAIGFVYSKLDSVAQELKAFQLDEVKTSS